MKKFGYLLLFLSSLVCADTNNEIANCANKDSDAARLICYDSLAKQLGVDQPKSKISTGNGNWKVREDRSPIDDSVNVYLSISAADSIRSGYRTVKPSLHIRCAENKTNAYLIWDLYLGLESTKMLTRFDKQNATTSEWLISTDSKAVFVQGSDINFAKKLMNHDKLLTQITPYGENPVMATFHISALEEAIKPLREACHW